jgi:uncharacterized protein YjdB
MDQAFVNLSLANAVFASSQMSLDTYVDYDGTGGNNTHVYANVVVPFGASQATVIAAIRAAAIAAVYSDSGGLVNPTPDNVHMFGVLSF